MSSVATDGKGGQRLKIEKNGVSFDVKPSKLA